MRRVAIIGVGCTSVGEIWDKSLKDLAVEASLKALDDAGIENVDRVYIGNALSPILQYQTNLASIIIDSLGFNNASSILVEAADASGGLAFHEAFKAVRSGLIDYALVVGVEKMSDSKPSEVASALMSFEDQDYVAFTGVTQAGLHALLLRIYMEKFNVKHEDIALFAVNAHKNASKNPYAQFKNIIRVEDVLRLLENIPERTTVVLTGRYAPRELLEKADVVNEIVEVKYPARMVTQKGIQY